MTEIPDLNARDLIEFYLEAGADALVGEEPVDRFAAVEAPPVAPRQPVERPAPVASARPAPAAQAMVAPDEAAIAARAAAKSARQRRRRFGVAG